MIKRQALTGPGLDAHMPCGTLRFSTKGVIKGWDYAVMLGKE